MGKKWQRINPADVNLSDEVRVVEEGDGVRIVYTGTITTLYDDEVEMVDTHILHDQGTWYIRRPKLKKYRPLTRPDEPQPGTFFRVERTGSEYVRRSYGYQDLLSLLDDSWTVWGWDDITEPGDTITELVLVEAQPTVMAMERES